jgi:hypothetical protein
MTTPEIFDIHNTGRPADYVGPHLSDGELLAEMEHVSAVLDGFRGTLGRLEQEAYRRIEERGATSLPSEIYICELVTTAAYDQVSFGPLKEVFHESDLKKCLTPAHTDTVQVPDKWTTATVKSLATKYGAEALRIVDKARSEGRGRLKFARRDAK